LYRHRTVDGTSAAIGRSALDNHCGLLCSKSQGRLPVVWFRSPSKSSWAVLHTVKRHGGRVQDVVTIELDVPRSWVRKCQGKIWHCPGDMPPERFTSVLIFSALASSPLAVPLRRADDLDTAAVDVPSRSEWL
jgi:hypothetical protein